ncbi:hypothetical protein B0F90DRAFT_1844729 [Multifurca ochricompacta]|uniref:Uncharacterized protein n=1 Tax=Multifurca ochricompacta TaxID=376703 RepID=A0AAD4QNM5_9AGAM|nr:hypothetical protein B0F90DRAFT_1844729 [Multifurca ochricompacta]
MNMPRSVIDRDLIHGTAPSALRTPPRRATPASSPLPPSSPFAEEDDYEIPGLARFHHVVPSPKLGLLQSLFVPKGPPDDDYEDNILHERHPSAPLLPLPLSVQTPTTLSSELVDLDKILFSTPGDSKECESERPSQQPQPDGTHSSTPVSTAPRPLALVSTPASALSTETDPVADQDMADTVQSLYSRTVSSALTILDEREHPASSPLSSPPSSPSPEQQQWQQCGKHTPLPLLPLSLPLSIPSARGTSVKRPAAEEVDGDLDADTDIIESECASPSPSTSASPAHTHPRAKRRRREADGDDKSWRDRKKHLYPLTVSTPTPLSASLSSHQPTASSASSPPARPPLQTSSPPDSSSSTSPTTSMNTSTSTSRTTPSSPPGDQDADDDDDDDQDDRIRTTDDEEEEQQKQQEQQGKRRQEPSSPCPHPALLGILLESFALSRASSLPLTTLTRTTPALADHPHAHITATLEWAMRARILGCVRSSGEALPPSYFYDPTMDPDRERGELLKCLMPRAGKRRETMKYKQYYWAPVVVGRDRTRTWDVDWEE